jgi:hypothetical protein
MCLSNGCTNLSAGDLCGDHFLILRRKISKVVLTPDHIRIVTPSGRTEIGIAWYTHRTSNDSFVANLDTNFWLMTYFALKRKRVQINKIKRAWRRCISNPEYKMCRDRLRREFASITF